MSRQWLYRALLFLLAFAVTYFAIATLSSANVTGLQGPPINNNPWHHANREANDFTVIGIVAAVVGVLTLARRKLGISWAILLGQIAAVGFAVLAVLIDF